MLKRLRLNRRGATATEYIVMIVLVALFVLGIIRVFGDTVKDKYLRANSELSGTLAEGDGSPDSIGQDGTYADGSAAGGQGQEGAAGAGGAQAGGAGGSGSAGGTGAASKGGKGGVGGSGSGGKGSGAGGGGSGEDVNAPGGGGGGGGGIFGGKGSFNPMILLAALLMVGLLLYVMFKGKDG